MDSYGKSLAKIAIAQLAQTKGFNTISLQSLDTLEEVLTLLIKKVGQRAKLIAEHSCRTDCNLLDTLRALEVLGYNCSLVKNALSVPKSSYDLCFCRSTEDFPKRCDSERGLQDYEYNEDNVPSFLPEFPPSHTYLFTPVPIKRNTDEETLREIRTKEKREIEELLARVGQDEGIDIEMGNSSNPFLSVGDIPVKDAFLDH